MMEEERNSGESFDFESWAKKCELKDSTVLRLRDEDYDTYNVLRELTQDDIEDLKISKGQQKALRSGIANLRGLQHTPHPEEQNERLSKERQEFYEMKHQKCLTWTSCDWNTLQAKFDNESFGFELPRPYAWLRGNDTSGLERDQISGEYLPSDGPIPLSTTIDGNCFFRAISKILFGSEDFHIELRLRIVKELIVNKRYYTNDSFLKKVTCVQMEESLFNLYMSCSVHGDYISLSSLDEQYQKDVIKSLSTKIYANIFHVIAASQVLGRPVHSIYPPNNNSCFDGKEWNVVVTPTNCVADESPPVMIMWTTTIKQLPESIRFPDHIVPLLPTECTGDLKEKEVKKGNETNSSVERSHLPHVCQKKDDWNYAMRKLLKDLGIEKRYPGKICKQQVLSFCIEYKEKQNQNQNCEVNFEPLMYLQDFLMFDHKARDVLFPSVALANPNTHIHPQDIFLSVFLCCDLGLKEVLMQRCFLCRLALPFVYALEDGTLQCSSWGLRFIGIEHPNHDGISIETSILQTEMSVVGCFRLGGLGYLSKSAILNRLLSYESHPTFFHRECRGGMTRRQVSDGMIEATLYLPTRKAGRLHDSCLMLLNLRGDCSDHQTQFKIVCEISSIVVMFVDMHELNSPEVLDSIDFVTKSAKAILVISSKSDYKSDERNDSIQLFKDNVAHVDWTKLSLIETVTFDMPKNLPMIIDEIGQALKMMLIEDPQKSIQDRIRTCRAHGCTLDEDHPFCVEGCNIAKLMSINWLTEPKTLKSDIMPLQGRPWHAWSLLQKKQHRTVGKGSEFTAREERDDLHCKMTKLRNEQFLICKQLPYVADTFIKALLSSQTNGTFDKEMPFFLSWLNFHLSELASRNLPAIKMNYQKKLRAFQNVKGSKEEEKRERKNELDSAEEELLNASLTLEHFFREMGQIYEAVHVSSVIGQQDGDMRQLDNVLPNVAAKLLLLGLPFELLDGDVNNIAMTWVKAVLSSAQQMLENTKIFIISVLGIQSSGKSTLLNTIFGLQFAVSAGRCTRGVYIQLIKIESSQKLPFDYVLVVDTEGLRAPDKDTQDYNHDNEIATFVIGLGDVNLINFTGESYGEMKDVLQVAVHAFLRMKLTSRSQSNRSRCVFVHQNVTAANANEKMLSSSQKLQENLDRLAVEVAQQENIFNIERFADILEFGDVFLFPELWHGDCPMAYVNSGYTYKAKQLKHHIILELSKRKSSYFNLRDISQHIEDLWQGILSEDFIFSFKNVLELKAYNQLDDKMRKITWDLEYTAYNMVHSTADPQLGSCGNNDELQRVETELMKEMSEFILNKTVENEKDLVAYFKNSDYADIIVQWREKKLQALREHNTGLTERTYLIISELRKRREFELLTTEANMTLKNEIVKEVINLANTFSGRETDKFERDAAFEKMWNEWEQGISDKQLSTTGPKKIDLDIQDALFYYFPSHHTSLRQALYSTPVGQGSKLPKLAGSWEIGRLSEDDSDLSIQPKEGKYIDKNVCRKRALELIEVAFTSVDSYLQNLMAKDVKYSHIYVKEVIETVLKLEFSHIDDHHNMALTPHFRVKLAVHACQHAFSVFCTLETTYERRHGFKAMIEPHMKRLKNLFENTVAEREEEVIADLICAQLEQKISSTVLKSIPAHMINYGMQSLGSKLPLLFKMLDNLATKNLLEKYLFYVKAPRDFTLTWIKEFLDNHFFKSNKSGPTRCGTEVRSKTNRLIKLLTGSMQTAMNSTANSTMQEWVIEFCNLAKRHIPIRECDFQDVLDKSIANPESFLKTIGEKLNEIGNNPDEYFEVAGPSSLKWEGKSPYEQVLDNIWGCEATCPFCGEPCQYSEPQHMEKEGMCHMCVQHRPEGVFGTKRIGTAKLVLEVCNYSVKHKYQFACSETTCRQHSTCAAKAKGETVFHNYRDYKKHAPDWDIPPGDDLDSSKYWLWYMATYNRKIADTYGLEPADIPAHWTQITLENAKESLRDVYKLILGD